MNRGKRQPLVLKLINRDGHCQNRQEGDPDQTNMEEKWFVEIFVSGTSNSTYCFTDMDMSYR